MRILLLILLVLALPAAAQRSVTSTNKFKVARTLFEQGNYEKASLALEAIVKEDSTYIDAQYLLGLSYLGQKKYKEAQEKLQATIDLDKLFLPAYQFLGQILLEQKKYKEAREHFLKMMTVPNGGTTARYCLGVVAYVQKDLAGAETEWRETLRLDPKHASAHNNLGILLQSGGKHREAIGEFKQAVRLSPDNPMYRFNVAWEYAELGEKNDAKQELERMKPRVGKRSDLENLGFALYAWLSGDADMALKRARIAVNQNPDLTQGLTLIARALEQQKKLDEARPAWQAVLDSDPNVKEAEAALKRIPEPKPSPSASPEASPVPQETPSP